MDVPLFPAPPTALGAVTSTPAVSVSDAIDLANLTPVSLSTIACNREGKNVRARTGRPAPHRVRRCSIRKNLVYPKLKGAGRARRVPQSRRRITELRIRMTEQPRNESDDDEDVVYAIDTPTTVSEDISPEYKPTVINFDENPKRSVTVQTTIGLPLRLRVFPSIKDIVEEDDGKSKATKGLSKVWKHIRFLGRLSLSMFGLLWLLCVWAVVGAVAFCATEGPREREQVVRLKTAQKELAVGLATDLRQLRTEKLEDVEPFWSDKVERYLLDHEELLLMAVNAGYGESGHSGQLWTFPGCVLFALSLLTTLGFGAPVPRTTAGRTITVIFAAIGIPAHFLLVMNFGLLLALRLQRYAISKKFVDYDPTDPKCLAPVPKWVKIVPFVCGVSYYLLGVICFGVARSRPFAASVLFPLDFTAAGGLSTIVGHVRILYGLYLEGAVAIAAVAVAVLRVSATQGLTHIGLKYGLLIEA